MQILIDAIYINSGGGKILLDYLIQKLEKLECDVFYLLDERVKDKHPVILGNQFLYLKPSLYRRHLFYKQYGKRFSTVVCFGNLPPTINLEAVVLTYFHQPLFLAIPVNIPFAERLMIKIKSSILELIKAKTDLWIVQNETIKKKIISKYNQSQDVVLRIPFYPPLTGVHSCQRVSNTFIYVSNFTTHKNHLVLVESFCSFYDQFKMGQLFLTIDSKNKEFCSYLQDLALKGYPIVNVGFVARNDLYKLYCSCEYLIFPSLAESFGLGLVEAIENGCKVIGADLPYTHEVCDPSILFDPYSKEDIIAAFIKAINKVEHKTTQKIYNQIDDLIDLILNHENTK